MEKKIVGISALCFGLVAIIALLGVLIQDMTVRRIVIIGGCIIVVLLTFLNFKLLRQMKNAIQPTPVESTKLMSMNELARWLQSETWAEILSGKRLTEHYSAEYTDFRSRTPDDAEIKGFRIWRSEENEKYFDEASGNIESILVLMDMTSGTIEVRHSHILYQELMLRQK